MHPVPLIEPIPTFWVFETVNSIECSYSLVIPGSCWMNRTGVVDVENGRTFLLCAVKQWDMMLDTLLTGLIMCGQKFTQTT